VERIGGLSQKMWHNHRLQATHKSASPFSFFQAAGTALLCAPEPKRYPIEGGVT